MAFIKATRHKDTYIDHDVPHSQHAHMLHITAMFSTHSTYTGHIHGTHTVVHTPRDVHTHVQLPVHLYTLAEGYSGCTKE